MADGEPAGEAPTPGAIVLADWRGGSAGGEANKRRPAVVVGDARRLPDALPTALLVPLSTDPGLAVPGLSLRIEPTPENGCPAACWALAFFVTATGKGRIRATPSRVTMPQLAEIRRQVALAVAVEA